MASENPVILVLDKDAESYMSVSKLFGQRVELARCDGLSDALRAADGREPFLSVADGDSADGLAVASRLKAEQRFFCKSSFSCWARSPFSRRLLGS